MTTNYQNVKEYFLEFLKKKEISSLAYISRNNNSVNVRQIRLRDLFFINNQGVVSFKFTINNHLASYIKSHLSPINKAKGEGNKVEDQNTFFLGISFAKIVFPERDTEAYIPFLMYDLTSEKENIISEALRTGKKEVVLDFLKEITINKEAIEIFCNFDASFNGKKIDEVFASNLQDFVPQQYWNSLENFINYLNSFFEKHIKPEYQGRIIFPKPGFPGDVVFMFFAGQKEIKYSKEIELAFDEKNPLIEEYIEYIATEEDIAKANILNETIWTGSLTKDYPLGKGQAIVMQKNQEEQKIIPVVGGPGTGKTTLFLSIIAQEVTKRAMTIANGGEDYNNMMLVTSTSNKAVENVYKNLRKGFKNGFVFIGGNSSNREKARQEVDEFIEGFKLKEFDIKKFEQYKKSIRNIINFFNKKEIEFYKLQDWKRKLGVSSLYEVKKIKNKIEGDVLVISDDDFIKRSKIIKEQIAKINHLTKQFYNIQDIISLLNQDIIAKLDLAIEKINRAGFFKKIFQHDSILDGLDLPFKVGAKDDIEIIKDSFKIIDAQDPELILEISQNKRKLKEIESLLKSIKEKTLDRILKSNDFADYFRTNFYSLNYRLYIQSLRFMEQYALKNKDKVLKAIGYLKAENQFEYIKEHYGFKKEKLEDMLKWISLVYPVSTSTLASIPQMFQGVYPNNVKPYNIVLADEAGMINVIDMIPALRRANRAIIVGDPKQLPPIVQLDDVFSVDLEEKYNPIFIERYNPLKISAFHRAAGTLEGGYKAIGRGVILDEHRRCAPQIAKLFIDIAEYEGLKICTHNPNNKAFYKIKEQLIFFDIKAAKNLKFGKVNLAEIKIIDTILKKLSNAGYDLKKDVGIITPYRNQESELIKAFGQILDHSDKESKIGTVHKFQGAEFKVIIFSSVVNEEDSLDFINQDPSLINVAISRAKEIFIAVGDFVALTKSKHDDNFIGKMASLMKERGLYIPMKIMNHSFSNQPEKV